MKYVSIAWPKNDDNPGMYVGTFNDLELAQDLTDQFCYDYDCEAATIYVFKDELKPIHKGYDDE